MAIARKRKNPPKALPFDPQIARARRNLLEDRMNYVTDYRNQVNSLNRDATNSLRSIDIEQPNIYRNILNSNAGRGMAYSSGYGYQLGQAANDLSTQRSNISTSLQDALSAMRADRRNVMNRYQYQLGGLNQQAAQNQIPNAGHLGFNRHPIKPQGPKKPKKMRRVI